MYEENQELQELNQIIDAPSTLVRLKSSYNEPILDRILALVASFNEGVVAERQVPTIKALKVAEISLSKNILLTSREQIEFRVFRELSNFMEMAVSGKSKDLALDYTDFLPIGHPLSTSPELLQAGEEEIKAIRADWTVADPAISPELRPMIASALVSPADSVEREYAIAMLSNAENSKVLKDISLALSDAK
jgi:hypothetical protein